MGLDDILSRRAESNHGKQDGSKFFKLEDLINHGEDVADLIRKAKDRKEITETQYDDLLFRLSKRQEKEIMGASGTMDDLHHKKEEEKLNARKDTLTQTLNRFSLSGEIEGLVGKLNKSEQRKSPESVIFFYFDMLDFKTINDKYGHDAGDQALVVFSECLKQIFSRQEDKIFRLGGDEFGVASLITNSDIETFRKKIEGIINNLFINVNGENIFFGVSFGFSTLEKGGQKTTEELIKEADANMYRHKKGQKDVVLKHAS